MGIPLPAEEAAVCADARLLKKESEFEKKSSVVQGRLRVRVLELR